MTPRFLMPGELLAIATNHIMQSREGFFWMYGPSSPQSTRNGDTAIVHLRGPLEHHAKYAGDSYEAVVERLRDAFSGEDAVRAYEREHRHEPGYHPLRATAPRNVVLCIDSPGGAVAGLFECVASIQKMKAANPGVKLSCYVNEMACSAAYAIACACDQIVAPESAVVGSIGVISTMVSVAEADKNDGIDVRLVTSGSRKADKNIHAPITDAAVKAEKAHVDKLAEAFFEVVSTSRGLSAADVESFQAGIFLGKDAKRERLVDDTMSFDAFLGSTANKEPMGIEAILRQLAAERDPKKIEALSAQLATAMAGAVAGMSPETPAPTPPTVAPPTPPAPAAQSLDEDQTTLALVRELTGSTGADARGVLRGLVKLAKQTSEDVEAMKKATAERERTELFASAKPFFTPTELAELEKLPLAEAKATIEFTKKRGAHLVHTNDGMLLKPRSEPGSEANLPKDTLEMIELSLKDAPAHKRDQYRKELVEAALKNHNDSIASTLNGAGRY